MRFKTCPVLGFRSSARNASRVGCLTLLIVWGLGPHHEMLADGCFVFRWDKNIDINEPTQKAIIVHDAGREDLLLQVKYEGPLEEFGWLIPIPALPTVVKGSMQPFYELSRLTQRQFGGIGGSGSAVMMAGSTDEPVKVIEMKTVGAYEVAVLSARDAGSLARWLETHHYSFPEGKSAIIEQYISEGRYFAAARIQIDNRIGFRIVVDRVKPYICDSCLTCDLGSSTCRPGQTIYL